MATILLDSFKENNTFLAVSFNFGKNIKIYTGRRAFLLENIIENWNLFIYFYTLNIPSQRIYFRKWTDEDEDIVHVSGDQGINLSENSKWNQMAIITCISQNMQEIGQQVLTIIVKE